VGSRLRAGENLLHAGVEMFEKEYRGASFYDFLRVSHPEVIRPPSLESSAAAQVPHGTTIVAVKHAQGAVIGGDRRATIGGHMIINEDIIKVFKTDDYSAMAIAGAFGPSVKMARLFQTELEHYEKVEGISLSLEGKAMRLSAMIEQNLPAAMQGLTVMPLFVGYDPSQRSAKIFEYDITGGTFSKPQEEDFSCSGSGQERAHAVFEQFYKPGMSELDAIRLVVRALDFAKKRDAATGGKVYIVKTVGPRGVQDAPLEMVQAAP
jgi:proteasome beta subunit